MKTKILYLFLLILIGLSACKSRQIDSQVISNKQMKVDSIYGLMQANQFNVSWFDGKFKGVYQMPESKQAFSGQIRVQEDSVIWISVTALMNIEVFRILIRPDSFFFLNRLEKTYMSESTKYLKDRFEIDLDFEMLQSLLMGNDFPYYETSSFKLDDNNQNYQLSTVARNKLKEECKADSAFCKVLIQNIWVEKQNYRIVKQNVKIIGSDKTKLIVNYDKFESIENQIFPMFMQFKLKEDQNTFVDIDYSRININEAQNFPFNIPSKYDQKQIKIPEE